MNHHQYSTKRHNLPHGSGSDGGVKHIRKLQLKRALCAAAHPLPHTDTKVPNSLAFGAQQPAACAYAWVAL